MNENDLMSKDLTPQQLEEITQTKSWLHKIIRLETETDVANAIKAVLPKLPTHRLTKIRTWVGDELEKRNG